MQKSILPVVAYPYTQLWRAGAGYQCFMIRKGLYILVFRNINECFQCPISIFSGQFLHLIVHMQTPGTG